jgi:hypothetical protein
MPDETRHESADLETEDAFDTLDGELGDDPLDAGLIPPERWSAGMRFGTTGAEETDGESLDQLLAAEEPDMVPDVDDEPLAAITGDSAATAEEAAVHLADDDDYDIRSE